MIGYTTTERLETPDLLISSRSIYFSRLYSLNFEFFSTLIFINYKNYCFPKDQSQIAKLSVQSSIIQRNLNKASFERSLIMQTF